LNDAERWEAPRRGAEAEDAGGAAGGRYHEGHFPHNAIDPNNPPRFESQAAYLERHGLLSPEERRRLPADAFEPELVTTDDDDDA
jgi:hypothetical protein